MNLADQSGPAKGGSAEEGPALSELIPSPLREDLRTALEATADGHDHNETAFALLIDAVRSLPEELPLPDRSPDWDVVLAGGDAARGQLALVEGTLVQRDLIEPVWGRVEEWFVRDARGRPIALFVVDPPEARVGQRVRLVGLTYKRIDAIGRDDLPHEYPAVVARAVGVTGMSAKAIPILVGAVLVMLVAFVLIRRRAARSRTRARAERSPRPLDASERVADDPVEALARLRQDAQRRTTSRTDGSTRDNS